MDLFEYDEQPLPDGLDKSEFCSFLDEIWQKYQQEKPEFWRDDSKKDVNDVDIKKKKRFLFFDENKIKSKNYVGYIKFKDHDFNLYPKICKGQEHKEITEMLLLWLQYSNTIQFPNLEASLSECENDFFEVLIYLFAKYTSDLFAVSLFQHYEEISEETEFLKGKLNFNEYLKNIICGKAHKFHCTYDSFEFNNKFNQIVKYVAKMLSHISKKEKNRNLLSEIILTLGEVDDIVCTSTDCDKVYINRFMEDFITVLDYCKLFLNNCMTFNTSGDFDTFAFLLRTEVLFEKFITNFMKENFGNNQRKIYAQSEPYLDNDNRIKIKPDILIKSKEDICKIIDIKYKVVNSLKDISHADIYQCVTYAYKLNCNDVTLLYPKVSKSKELPSIKIKDIQINFVFVDPKNKDILMQDIDKILNEKETQKE